MSLFNRRREIEIEGSSIRNPHSAFRIPHS